MLSFILGNRRLEINSWEPDSWWSPCHWWDFWAVMWTCLFLFQWSDKTFCLNSSLLHLYVFLMCVAVLDRIRIIQNWLEGKWFYLQCIHSQGTRGEMFCYIIFPTNGDLWTTQTMDACTFALFFFFCGNPLRTATACLNLWKWRRWKKSCTGRTLRVSVFVHYSL